MESATEFVAAHANIYWPGRLNDAVFRHSGRFQVGDLALKLVKFGKIQLFSCDT
jgi:hypothetical protein